MLYISYGQILFGKKNKMNTIFGLYVKNKCNENKMLNNMVQH